MEIFYHPNFRKEYRALPEHIQLLAEKKESIFRKNPFDQRLKTHKLHGGLSIFYSWSINQQYRVLFRILHNTVQFLSVGTHNIYK